jgi:phospholipase C
MVGSTRRRRTRAMVVLVALALAMASSCQSGRRSSGGTSATTPGPSEPARTTGPYATQQLHRARRLIQHVVIVFQENHTFDELLGRLCIEEPERNCDGVASGLVSTGRRVELRHAPDIPPKVRHQPRDQVRAIHGGAMDRFNTIKGCGKAYHYRCYMQYRGNQIPSLWKLAQDYSISDRTFETDPVTSWGSHMELASATMDGFLGYNPLGTKRHPPGGGWGCDSFKVTPWRSPSGAVSLQPSCVAKPDGTGPFIPSPVRWVPTIMDRLEVAGLSWRIYGAGQFSKPYDRGYAWTICPTFADCLYSDQSRNLVDFRKVLTAGRAGRLPALSIVVPYVPYSQHNGTSMMKGDNWIAQVVNAIGAGPDWQSTVIFITYDDCGCFYDHVSPPAGTNLGIRIPMVIVSPYAKRAYTDSSVASFASMLAYTEHLFGLQSLTIADRTAYDYRNSFDYRMLPRRFRPLTLHDVPPRSVRYVMRHPPKTVD